ncbi:GNAT family N-acetyltransferase [Lysinibacillus sp. NPDC097195]|uniref:GNAT family N-acetyltransferase n=1 Tax=Lysinibacillus sp. NPDC097195 TaxID=3364141 RepID=UPI0038141565
MVSIIEVATLEHVEELCKIDQEVIGDNSRKDTIMKAIKANQCLIQRRHSTIAGFLIFTTDFFECSFISFIIVKSSERRKGVATTLLANFIAIAPTSKIFSSTNSSNKQMQRVFDNAGFKKSGYIENLDDGDPEIIYFTMKK